jgi:hypothetical protein
MIATTSRRLRGPDRSRIPDGVSILLATRYGSGAAAGPLPSASRGRDAHRRGPPLRRVRDRAPVSRGVPTPPRTRTSGIDLNERTEGWAASLQLGSGTAFEERSVPRSSASSASSPRRRVATCTTYHGRGGDGSVSPENLRQLLMHASLLVSIAEEHIHSDRFPRDPRTVSVTIGGRPSQDVSIPLGSSVREDTPRGKLSFPSTRSRFPRRLRAHADLGAAEVQRTASRTRPRLLRGPDWRTVAQHLVNAGHPAGDLALSATNRLEQVLARGEYSAASSSLRSRWRLHDETSVAVSVVGV